MTGLTAVLYFAATYQNPGLIRDYGRPLSLSGSAREISTTQKTPINSSSTGPTTAAQPTLSTATKLQTVVDTEPITGPQKPSYQKLQEGSMDMQDVPAPSLPAEKISTDEGMKGIELVKMKTAEELLPAPIDDTITVEARFCTVCEMLQPLRAKHCKACNSCVALHDHHCPWLGTCIGEKNRLLFYWYLVAQTGLLYFALYLVLSE